MLPGALIWVSLAALTNHYTTPHSPDMSTLPSFLTPAAVQSRVLNRLLQREDWARRRLDEHAGKTVRFMLGPVSSSLTIITSGLTQASDPAIVPDVTLTIPAEHLAELPALARQRNPEALTAIMRIEGDAGLAQTVSGLARDLRWDVEDALAQRVGDVAALKILGGARLLADTARRGARNLAENLSEYLAHEEPLITSRSALDSWSAQVQAMSRQLDQLEHRMQALDGHASRTPGHRPHTSAHIRGAPENMPHTPGDARRTPGHTHHTPRDTRDTPDRAFHTPPTQRPGHA